MSHAQRMAVSEQLAVRERMLLRFLNKEITSREIDNFTNGKVRTFSDAVDMLHEIDPVRY